MKKIISMLMAMSILLCLCACSAANDTHENETTAPVPAETTVPPTTESIPVCDLNGHAWVEASCSAPKTCSVCNITEGEALAHAWVDANYQAPKTCSVCGAAEGEPLTAAFEEYGLKINMTELDKEYDYVTVCSKDRTKETVAKLTLSNYRIFDGDENHPALEGYEWHALTATLRIDDDNAWNYGCKFETCRENYYDIIGWDNSQVYLTEEKMFQYTANINGTDYTEVLYDDDTEYVWSEWADHACTCTFERYVRVPVGYDGVILGFYNAVTEWGDGMHINDIADEDTLFFRLDGTGAVRAE